MVETVTDRARPARDWRIRPAGDAAVTLEFEPRIDPGVNARVTAAAALVAAGRFRGVRDVVPSYHAVTVYVDPLRADAGRVRAALEEAASAPPPGPDASREVVIPVRYGGAAGPDLEEVAAFAGCIAFAWLPNTSRTPAANVPAMPIAVFISSASSPSTLPAPAAAPNTPAVPVMCQPMS